MALGDVLRQLDTVAERLAAESAIAVLRLELERLGEAARVWRLDEARRQGRLLAYPAGLEGCRGCWTVQADGASYLVDVARRRLVAVREQDGRLLKPVLGRLVEVG